MEEDVTDASDLIETIPKLSGASYALSRKVVVEYGIAELVAEASMSPMLFEMSADGTPIVVFKQQSSLLPCGKVVHRKAKQTEEFLVRNHFVRCTLPDGNACCRPRPRALETL